MQHQHASPASTSLLPEEIVLRLQSIATNEVLPDDQIKILQTQRVSAVDELQLLDAEIAMAELKAGDLETDDTSWLQIISTAKKRRRLLTRFLKAVSIGLAPHKALPNEVLSQIFILALHGYSIYLPLAPRSISPLTFCHICSRWRQVALNTPDIWTNVTVRYEHALDTFRTMTIAEQWFARSHSSQSLSLTFGVWDWRVYKTNHEEVVRQLLSRLIVPYIPRLGQLTLYLTRADFFRFLLLSNHSFPNLRTLSLTTDLSFTDRLPLTESIEFQPIQAPNLEDLRLQQLSTTDINLLDHLRGLPWAKLTCFHISTTSSYSVTVHQVLHALSHCRLLTECSVTAHCIFRDEMDVEPTKPFRIRLQHLKRLTFASPGRRCLEAFFEPLTLPALKELTIHNHSSRPNVQQWPHDTFTNLYQRSQFSLELFHLQDIAVGDNDIWELVLPLHQSLTTLHLDMINTISERMLRCMLENNLLPCILCLVGKIGRDMLELLVEVLERRMGRSRSSDDVVGKATSVLNAGLEEAADELKNVEVIIARPQFVMIEYYGTIIPEIAQRIDWLREQGMRFDMSRWVV